MLGPRSEEKVDRVFEYLRKEIAVAQRDAFADPKRDGFQVFSVAYRTGLPTTPGQNPFAAMRVQTRSQFVPVAGAGLIMGPVRHIAAPDVPRSTAVTVGQPLTASAGTGARA